MSRPLVRFWYAVLVAFVACVACAFAAVLYAAHVQQESERRAELVRVEADRRWCNLLTQLDEAYSSPAPSTPTGRSVAAEIHRLRSQPAPVGFGCPVR